jgi:hypothetical protein
MLRRALTRRLGGALPVVMATALMALAPGCGDELVDEDKGDVPLTEIPHERNKQIPLQKGYIDGKAVEFYRMGTFVPADTAWFPSYEEFPGMPVGEMFVWIAAGGKLNLDNPQRPIIDTLPMQAGYSDFFELVAVSGPGDYNANDIKSRATLLRAGYNLQHSGRVVNCPVVGPDAKLAPTTAATGVTYPLVKLWHRGRTVHCLLMDGGVHLLGDKGAPVFKVSTTEITDDRNEMRVSAAEIYSLIARAFGGSDAVGQIQVPESDIFRYAPGSGSYSPLAKIWDVTVPSDYQVGEVVSHADLFPVPDFTDPRIEEHSPESFCNCPIARVGK